MTRFAGSGALIAAGAKGRRRRAPWAAFGLLALVVTPVPAADVYLATDVAVAFGGSDYPTEVIVLDSSGVTSVAATLPAPFQAGALHRRKDGTWLLSPAHPVALGGNEYEPRDVFSWDGAAAYAMVLDGSAAGIPGSARIDALFQDATGALILSFDIPVNLGGTEFSPSDLVRFEGGTSFSLTWNAEGLPLVPAEANLVGADRDAAGTLVVAFDIPSKLGGSEFLPGELAGWTGSAWFHYQTLPSWPPDAQLRDFAFVPGAGAVPDGASLPGVPLTVTPASGGDITLAWGSGCDAADADYEIYEGLAGIYYSHTPRLCTTGGLTSMTLTPGSGDVYYLVVPRNALREGSYGTDSAGAERPPGASACLIQQVSTCP